MDNSVDNGQARQEMDIVVGYVEVVARLERVGQSDKYFGFSLGSFFFFSFSLSEISLFWIVFCFTYIYVYIFFYIFSFSSSFFLPRTTLRARLGVTVDLYIAYCLHAIPARDAQRQVGRETGESDIFGREKSMGPSGAPSSVRGVRTCRHVVGLLLICRCCSCCCYCSWCCIGRCCYCRCCCCSCCSCRCCSCCWCNCRRRCCAFIKFLLLFSHGGHIFLLTEGVLFYFFPFLCFFCCLTFYWGGGERRVAFCDTLRVFWLNRVRSLDRRRSCLRPSRASRAEEGSSARSRRSTSAVFLSFFFLWAM